MDADIEKLVRRVMREEIAGLHHACRFAMTDDEARDMGDYMRMLSVVGDGSISKGVDTIRDNHKWLKTQRDRGERLSGVIAAIVVTAAIGGVMSALWLGIKALIVGSNVR